MNIAKALTFTEKLESNSNVFGEELEALKYINAYIRALTGLYDGLPPLPYPEKIYHQYGERIDYYTTEQVREYVIGVLCNDTEVIKNKAIRRNNENPNI